MLKLKLTNVSCIKMFLFLNLNLFLNLSCNTTEPPPPPPDETKPTLTLELDDTSCTEAWLQLTTKDLQLPAELTLKQYNLTGDSVTQTFSLSTKDSLLYIDSLLQNQSYKFKVLLNTTNHPQPTTNQLTITTMDTTSHNFTWQTFEFGQHSSSVLYDVAIINENNIWAVGEIYMNDSLGNTDLVPYSIAKWDGIKWELKKIFYNTNSIIAPIRGILVLNSNEIYLSAGGIFRWDGLSSHAQLVFSRLNLPDPNATIEKLWGRSSNAIFGVGNVGTLVYSSGNTWTILEIGTTSNINDIWGEVDQVTGERKILCAATDRMLSINSNNQVDSLSYFSSRTVSSIWFKGKHKFFSSGDGVFINTNNKWQEQSQLPFYYTYIVRGNSNNNVFVGGAFGLAAHYNGVSWQRYTELTFSSGRYIGISVKSNKVCFVGRKGVKAIIVLNN